MTTFTMIILIIFVTQLSAQFVKAVEAETYGLMFWFAIEIMAFAYLAKVLM